VQKASPLKDPNWAILGRIGRAHGVQGWVKIISFTEPFSELQKYSPWYLYKAQHWQKLQLLACKIQGHQLLAKIAGWDSPEQVSAYTNLPLAVKREQLPHLPPGEFYWSELIGLSVYNCEQHYLGKVISLMETGANDVLVVQQEQQEMLIPYLPERTILKVDLTVARIDVDWTNEFI